MIRVRDLAQIVGGSVVGDGAVEVVQVAQAADVRPGEIAYAVSAKFVEIIRKSPAAAVFVREPADLPIPQIVVPDPKVAAIQAALHFAPPRSFETGATAGSHVHPDAVLHPTASIQPGAVVAARVRIGARSVVMSCAVIREDAVIGDDAVIHPNVTVGERCVVGDRTVLHAGVCIGADGFGYFPDGEANRKIPQAGIVVIGCDVEIGANSCVDRATVGRTVVGDGTKIDNLVQIGHNCVIGKNCLLVAQVGLAGSVRLGDNCILAARAGVADNLEVGAGSIVAGMSGVGEDLPPGSKVGGVPAYNAFEWKRNLVHQKNLHRAVLEIERLSARVAELERLLSEKKGA